MKKQPALVRARCRLLLKVRRQTLFHLPMSCDDLKLRPELCGQLFGQVHGTVLAARTADGDGNVAAAFVLHFWQPFAHKTGNVVQHFLRQRLAVQETDNRLLHAVERAQFGLVVGIGQAAHVEHEIGTRRAAVFEAERFDADEQAVVFSV